MQLPGQRLISLMRKASQDIVIELEEERRRVKFNIAQTPLIQHKKQESKKAKENLQGELADLVAGILEDDVYQ